MLLVISEAKAAAIRATFEQRGEFAAAVEVPRLFPGITSSEKARECVRAGWRPLPKRPRPARLWPEEANPRSLPSRRWGGPVFSTEDVGHAS